MFFESISNMVTFRKTFVDRGEYSIRYVQPTKAQLGSSENMLNLLPGCNKYILSHGYFGPQNTFVRGSFCNLRDLQIRSFIIHIIKIQKVNVSLRFIITEYQ